MKINRIIHLTMIFALIIILLASLYLNIHLLYGGDEVSKYHIAVAEKIIGVKFTMQEREAMLGNVNENKKKYDGLRNTTLRNSDPPALMFNVNVKSRPVLKQKNGLKITECGIITAPIDLNDVSFYTIPQLAYLIKTRQITSTQLTKMYINRLKKYDSRLNCVITFTEELALKQAQKADEEIKTGNYRGLLHGIPWGAKDLLATKGIKTTWGAKPFKNQIIDRDATVVKKLEDAGAVLVAKLSLGALATTDVWFGGKTRNPWNTSEGAHGSSAGSAAAVAAGLVPFSIGSETWGSIITPCSRCGVTGLRPTFGRVSRAGAMTMCWTMDKIGPICRTAEDCAIVLDAIMGSDGEDLTVQDVLFNYNSDINLGNITIGYVKRDFDSEYPWKETDLMTLEMLRNLGANLVPITLPDVNVSIISYILSAETSAVWDEFMRSDKDKLLVPQSVNCWPYLFKSSRFIPAAEYINANRVRFMVMKEMDEIMDSIDLFVRPAWIWKNLLLTNLTGHPCVVVPNGFSEKGMPRGICFIGKLYDEGTILAVAQAYQNETEFYKTRPEIKLSGNI